MVASAPVQLVLLRPTSIRITASGSTVEWEECTSTLKGAGTGLGAEPGSVCSPYLLSLVNGATCIEATPSCHIFD